MSSDGSFPKPQSAAQATAAAASGASLAPGFRFHPTDEELVSYYLKRKVLSKPFAVDAISDVDLYKVEPWDLPGKSRIQSRDMEWYFFGSLDKKYSNRSKTNRATEQGYWKTTGKDRAVKRGSRTVGMKKTLVFHVGRAPKGERTNWVMHEYRLEDEELAKVGVAQDVYVVCRVFQKNGPGPQNGAQYGAPFVEEDWEDDERLVVGWGSGGGNFLVGYGNNDDQFVHQGQNMDIQNEITAQPVDSNDNRQVASTAVDTRTLLAGATPNEVVAELNEDSYLPELGGGVQLTVLDRMSSLVGSPQSPLTDDYLELNDFKSLDVKQYDLQGSYEVCSNLGGLNGIEEFSNSLEGNLQVPKQEVPAPVEDDFYLEACNTFTTGSDSLPVDNHMLYFDADLHLSERQDSFVEMMDFVDTTNASAAYGPCSLEEPMTYFEATEDNDTDSTPFDYTEFLDFSSQDPIKLWDEDDGGAKPGVRPSPQQQLKAGNVAGVSSLQLSGNRKDGCSNSAESTDVGYGHAPDKSIKGRLISMLGSIASPPALAAESKANGFNPAAPASSSIHITAGMIHINGIRMRGSGEPWSVPKSEDVGFLLSYDTARADISRNSSGFAQVGKMHCSSTCLVVRRGYCLSFLCVLFMTVFVKIGSVYLCKVK